MPLKHPFAFINAKYLLYKLYNYAEIKESIVI